MGFGEGDSNYAAMDEPEMVESAPIQYAMNESAFEDSTNVFLPFYPNAISINPINWKLDGTYAPASENLGSLVPNEKTQKFEIGDVGADAQVIPSRGVILTNAKIEPMPAELAAVASEFFGPDGRHESDYTFYYNNIKDNVAKWIATFTANR